jgi:radical SAM superfamily enzyme YgiQ (UPF0313 family)
VKRPENALHEIMHLSDRYKIRNFSINDSLMNGSHKLLLEFCESVIKMDFDIRFYGYCRVDKKLKQDILDKMAKAGCYSISFGVESGSRKILDKMDKGVKKEFILPTLRRASKAKVKVVCCFMVGYPGENLWDYLETFILIWRGRKIIDTMNLAIFQPSHETHMMAEPSKYNLISSEKHGWVSTEFWNSPFIQRWKYQLIRRFWSRYKNQRTSPGGWDYTIEK